MRTALTKIPEAMATIDVPVALVLFPLFVELKNFFEMMNMRGLIYTGNLISLPALKTSIVLAVLYRLSSERNQCRSLSSKSGGAPYCSERYLFISNKLPISTGERSAIKSGRCQTRLLS